MRPLAVLSTLALLLTFARPLAAQAPTPTVVDSPTVKVLTGLLAPQFQEEMNFVTQALGVTCGTCHVYVREPQASLLPPTGPDELGMLEFVAAPRRPNSRLSCQIKLTQGTDGITVDLPESQY